MNFAESQVFAIFRTQVGRQNVLQKFIELNMETPQLCPGEGHSNGGQKSTKTSGIQFCYKNQPVRPFELADIHINTFHNTTTVQIAKNH